MAVEKRSYEVLERDGAREVRLYGDAVVAETTVTGDFEDVGNEAFRILVRYISGANVAQEEVAMTAPVTQRGEDGAPRSEKIAMTAPVSQERTGDVYRVTFLMPSEYSLEALPEPSDDRVRLRREPGGRMAAIRYRGSWRKGRYDEHLEELRTWMEARSLEAAGQPVWARYDPPFMPWFLRRNEILVPVAD